MINLNLQALSETFKNYLCRYIYFHGARRNPESRKIPKADIPQIKIPSNQNSEKSK